MKFKDDCCLSNYLLSNEYAYDMKYCTVDDNAGHKRSGDYARRHSEQYRKGYGIWRWSSIFLHRSQIIPIIFDDSKQGVDFGGAEGLLRHNIDIIDIQDTDVMDRPVKYHKLSEYPHKVDFIFSSHALEHMKDIASCITDMANILKNNGTLILNLPSYTCNRWHAGAFPDVLHYPQHYHTFCLSPAKNKHIIPIDTLLKQQFIIDTAEYSGDNCIIIICHKKQTIK